MDEQLRRDLNENKPVKVKPLAKAAGWSFNSIYKAVKTGEVKSICIGRGIRIPPAEARRILGLEEAA